MKFLKVLLALGVIIFLFNCTNDDILQQDAENNIETRQVKIGEWESQPCAQLTIFVDGNCHENWSSQVEFVIDSYNDVPDVAIELVQVTTNDPRADIVINCVDFGPGFSHLSGLSEIPATDGVIGDDIYLNTDDDEKCDEDCFYSHVIMHELAHNLGILHNEQTGCAVGPIGNKTYNSTTGVFTYDDPDATIKAEQIAGTHVGTESGSIFNATTDCDNHSCSFTPDDILALQALYPLCGCVDLAPCQCFLPEINIVGPSEFCFNTSDEIATFCAVDLPPGSTLSVSGDGFSSQINGDCIMVSFDDPGFIDINIEVCIDGCCTTIVKTIAADNQCCNTCYCECETPIEGTNPLEYEIVRNKISCLETESCDELFPPGDEYFDCKRISVPTPLDVSINGDEEICLEDGYGTWCVIGLSPGTSTTWTINGPGVSDTETSPNSCLSYDLDLPGTYVVSTTVCEGECCETLVHSIVVNECEGCYCECWELIQDVSWNDGFGQSIINDDKTKTKGRLKYRRVILPIDCEDDCDEQYPIGDEYFDCVKIMM